VLNSAQRVLALLSHVVLVDAARGRTYLARLVFIGLPCLALVGAINLRGTMGAPGLRVFSGLIFWDIVLISTWGAHLFAGAIVEDREAGTLDLLRISGLSPASLCLGKGVSRMLRLLLLLIAQLPFAVLAVTLGGITLAQVFAAFLGLLCYTILVANLGLFCSLVCKKHDSATSVLLLLLLVSHLALPNVLPAIWPHFGDSYVIWLAPVRCMKVLSAFDGQILHVSLLANCATSLLFFLLCCMSFEFFTKQRGARVAPGAKRKTRRHRRPFAWRYPLAWKRFHVDSYGTFSLIGRVLFIAFLLWILATPLRESYGQESHYMTDPFAYLCLFGGLAGLIIELFSLGGALFKADCKQRTWAGLFILPLRLRDIGTQIFLGGIILLIPWVLVAVWGLLLLPMPEKLHLARQLDYNVVSYLLSLGLFFFAASIYGSTGAKQNFGLSIICGFVLCLSTVVCIPLTYEAPALAGFFLCTFGVALNIGLTVLVLRVTEARLKEMAGQ
jgi:hypothetical protein